MILSIYNSGFMATNQSLSLLISSSFFHFFLTSHLS